MFTNEQKRLGTIWLPQQITIIRPTDFPGGAPGGTSGTWYRTEPRRRLTTPNFSWMK